MAIRPPPKEKIEKFINEAGEVKADKASDGWTMISLRIPVSLVNQIEEYKEDYLGMTRTAFILQAIQEKLKKVE